VSERDLEYFEKFGYTGAQAYAISAPRRWKGRISASSIFPTRMRDARHPDESSISTSRAPECDDAEVDVPGGIDLAV